MLPDGSANVDGAVPVRDLNRAMDWNIPDDEATTIAGVVIHEARSIPEPGQSFTFHGYRFQVLRKTRNRITALRVTPLVRKVDSEGELTSANRLTGRSKVSCCPARGGRASELLSNTGTRISGRCLPARASSGCGAFRFQLSRMLGRSVLLALPRHQSSTNDEVPRSRHRRRRMDRPLFRSTSVVVTRQTSCTTR